MRALAGAPRGFDAVALDELDEALGADAAAATWASMSPTTRSAARMLSRMMRQTIVPTPLVLDLDGVEQQALGVRVGRVDDAAAARRQRAEVEVVRGGDGEADQLGPEEDRHDEADVGRCEAP